MIKRFILFFLALFLIGDLTFSFIQHYNMPLDGDMAGGIVPHEEVETILKDPFGFSVITDNAVYPNPNRYFAHWAFYAYFNNVPLWLQSFVSPIESVYLAGALAKIFIQLLILILLSFYITGKTKIFNSDFLIAAVLVIPLFQTNGYRGDIGIIDPSLTYTFFYALPCALILLFYLPFYLDSIYSTTFLKKWIVLVGLFGLSFYAVFNGALNPGIILIITLLYGLERFSKTEKSLPFIQRAKQIFKVTPKEYLFFFTLISLLSIYALYIGKNNSIFLGETIPISERYARIPKGIFLLLSKRIGYPTFLIAIGINIFLTLRLIQDSEFKKSLRLYRWIGLFIFFYILLLPLGGYKEYRPNILRYDTTMPITIGLIFIYAMSSFQLIKYFIGKGKYAYLIQPFIFTFIFTNADELELNKKAGECRALEKISRSNEKVVLIESDCTVLSWSKITDPKRSVLNGQLLKKWHITTDEKVYYQNN